MTETEMLKRKIINFNRLLINFMRIFDNNFYLRYLNLDDALRRDTIDLDTSIMHNINNFMNSIDKYQKGIREYQELKENYQDLLLKLAAAPYEIKDKFYNKKLVDVILEQNLVPYEQVDITRLYFNNSDQKSKIELLDEHCTNILNGGNNFKVINSLDRIAVNPELLRTHLIYQIMIERLIYDHLKFFDKYKEQDKDERNFDKFCIRLVYRHQNRGYYVPDGEYRDAIINTYAYNGWFKELKHMISKNSLGITKENYMQIIEQIQLAFDDMAIVCRLSEGMYMAELEKYNEIIAMVCDVAEQEHKLTRKEGE